MDEIIITLQQRVNALEGNPVIFIGSQSGFFFIGTKEEYEANIDAVSEFLFTDMKEKLYEMQRKNNDFYGYLSEIIKIDPETKDENELKKIGELARRINTSTATTIKRNRWIPETEENIRNFKNVRERISMPPEDRLQGDGIIITVEGVEKGRYWFYEEYKTGVVPEDDEDADDEAENEIVKG